MCYIAYMRSVINRYFHARRFQSTKSNQIDLLWASPPKLYVYGTCAWHKTIFNKFVRPRWPYVMRPSVCHCNSLGGAK